MERLRATFLFIKNSVFTPPQAEAVSKSSPFHKTGDQFFAQANALIWAASCCEPLAEPWRNGPDRTPVETEHRCQWSSALAG